MGTLPSTQNTFSVLLDSVCAVTAWITNCDKSQIATVVSQFVTFAICDGSKHNFSDWHAIWYVIWYLIWCDVMWCDMVYDIIWCMTWYHMISYDMMRCHMISYDIIWYDAISYDIIWYYMIWHIMLYHIISYHHISYVLSGEFMYIVFYLNRFVIRLFLHQDYFVVQSICNYWDHVSLLSRFYFVGWSWSSYN